MGVNLLNFVDMDPLGTVSSFKDVIFSIDLTKFLPRESSHYFQRMSHGGTSSLIYWYIEKNVCVLYDTAYRHLWPHWYIEKSMCVLYDNSIIRYVPMY